METPSQSKNLMILAAKGKDKKSRKQLKQGFEKKNYFSAFVNFSANMSYTPALGSEEVYIVSSTWGQKMSNNRCPLFTMLTKQKLLNVLHSKLVKKQKVFLAC